MRVAIDGRLLPNQPANLHVFYHDHTEDVRYVGARKGDGDDEGK